MFIVDSTRELFADKKNKIKIDSLEFQNFERIIYLAPEFILFAIVLSNGILQIIYSRYFSLGIYRL
jgi:hypothetical protein